MHLSDLGSYYTVGRPQLHPDGHRIAFDVSRMELDEDRYVQTIWLWDEEARPFTAGPGDSTARWSADGTRLAFLRVANDGPAQLAVMPAAGGEAQIITEFALGVRNFEWSPDGTRLAVEATTWLDEWADLDEDERARKPRRIRHAGFRFDTRGWLHDRRSHVWIVDPSGREAARRLTGFDPDETALAWSPTGSHIALLSTHDDPTRMARGTDILEVEVATGATTYRHRRGAWSGVAYDPDGDLLAVGEADPDNVPGLASLWRIDRAGDPVDLTGHLDRSVWSFLLPLEMARPAWLPDGCLLGFVDSGRVHVIKLGAAGEHEIVIGGDRQVTGYTATADGARIVFTADDPTNPGELHESTADGERVLTDLNEEFRASIPLCTPHHMRIPGDDSDIDTWVMIPEGDGPFPVLLNIHGGPASQYGFMFFDEFQVYAGAGYAIVACNPRGSSGRGRAFVRAVTGAGWGEVDTADVSRALEAGLAAHPQLDGGRLGVMGGSYGGFLTAWIIGRDDRFRSAVVERALLNWESFSGTSDIAPHFARTYLDAEPPADRDRLAAASPLTFADRITTPTLILHSEADHRCPIEQAEQLFMTLLRNEVDTEFIRFPGESHELSRSGKPRHRVERFESILEWHGRHLRA